MKRKVLGSLSKVSCDSTKPTKMIAWQESDFWEDYEKYYSSIKLLKHIFK